MEQNNGKEVWQTIGAIVGSLSGMIALVLQADRLAALAKRILKWTRERWSMLRECRYWKQHSPLFSIMDFSSLRVKKTNGSAEIEVTGAWQSRETNANLTIIEGYMLLDIGNSCPKLICHCNSLTLNPVERSTNITYKFIGTVCVSRFVNLDSLLKQIGSIVKCEIEAEKVWLRDLGARRLKVKPFKAKVKYLD